MNLLREEFCKETNTPIGLDDVYNYVKWLENKWQQKRSYSEEDMISFAHFYFREEFNSTMQTSKSTDKIFKEWFEQFKKK